MLVSRGMEGGRQSIVLMTEPYTFDNKIAGMTRGTKLIHGKAGEGPPRAGIVSSLNVNITAMDSWCNRDCAVALARRGGV